MEKKQQKKHYNKGRSQSAHSNHGGYNKNKNYRRTDSKQESAEMVADNNNDTLKSYESGHKQGAHSNFDSTAQGKADGTSQNNSNVERRNAQRTNTRYTSSSNEQQTARQGDKNNFKTFRKRGSYVKSGRAINVETVTDIKKDIYRIEKEIVLEIESIKTLKL